jgi:hypothetical protein
MLQACGNSLLIWQRSHEREGLAESIVYIQHVFYFIEKELLFVEYYLEHCSSTSGKRQTYVLG